MKIFRSLLVLGVILAMLSTIALAVETKRIASITDLKGAVEVRSPNGKWVSATPGMVLNQGDIIRTKVNSWAMLNLDGKGETAKVEVKQNSQLQLAELLENKPEDSQTTLLDLSIGKLLIKARKISEKSKFEVKTPTSIVGVRGTTFSVMVEAIE